LVIPESEILLQKLIHRLGNIISKYGLTISTSKTKTMALKGETPLEAK
jgi:hypothetical protein